MRFKAEKDQFTKITIDFSRKGLYGIHKETADLKKKE